LEDDLEETTIGHISKHTFVKIIGDYIALFRCSDTACDVYYCEVLVGRLYVGHLYSFTREDLENPAEDTFCPVGLISSLTDDNFYIESRCDPEGTAVDYYFGEFDYKKPEKLVKLNNWPTELEDSEDRQFFFLNSMQVRLSGASVDRNVPLALSISLKKIFYLDEYDGTEKGTWITLGLEYHFEENEKIIKFVIDYTARKLDVIYKLGDTNELKIKNFEYYTSNWNGASNNRVSKLLLKSNNSTAQNYTELDTWANDIQVTSPILTYYG
jgi:hypothetical protein